MKWQITTPANIEIVGSSQAGKSTLIYKLLEDESVWDKKICHICYCAPLINQEIETTAILSRICQGKKLLILDCVPTTEQLEDFREGREMILVLDDVLMFPKSAKEMIQSIVMLLSHHFQISLIMAVQNPFLKSKTVDLTTFARNLTARFLMYSVNDYYVFRILNSRIFPEKKNFILQCLQKAKEKYGCNYIFLNLNSHSGISRRHICYTAMFQHERNEHGDSPIFFDFEDS